MGVTTSTSLSKLKENPVLLKFVGSNAIPENHEFWKELLTFSYVPPKSITEAKILEETVKPLLESLVRNNPHTGNLRSLVKIFLELASPLRDESKCESNVATWQVHNALLIIRLSLKHIQEHHSETEAILQLDGSMTIPQITSLEDKTETQGDKLRSGDHVTKTSDNHVSSSDGHLTSISGHVTSSSGHVASSGSHVTSSGSHVTVNSTTSSETLTKLSNPLLSSVAEHVAGRSEDVKLAKPSAINCSGGSINPAEVASMGALLSRQLVEGLIALLAEVPLIPFTYDVHLEAINLFLVLLSSQMYPRQSSGIFLRHILATPSGMASLLVHSLIQHFISQHPLPPQDFRTQSSGIISSITSGLWSLVMPTRSSGISQSPLADQSLLLMLVISHQESKGHNAFRSALFSFTDDHESKSSSSFCVSLEKLYLTLCQQLTNEQTTLFLYLLLQGNSNVASFIFSRSDIDQLVLPLLRLLHDCSNQSSHHIYMLLIIVLILSQDDCFNKSIHEVTLAKVPWYTERTVANIPLGSLMVMVLVRTIQVNISQIRDKYLHTNCLAALANMSSHFHSLHLDAAQKIVNLFKLLAKKHQKISEKLRSAPSSPASKTSPSSPIDSESSDNATDRSILEEILQMVLEITNSCLTHNLHNNPHLVYSLLYQREVFEPYRTHPSLMDLVQNIETVIAFFSTKLEKSGPSPYSSTFVLETIIQASKSWPRNRLRVFPELKFRYVEEDQPEEFFVPYVWTLVFKSSALHWDNSKIHFCTS